MASEASVSLGRVQEGLAFFFFQCFLDFCFHLSTDFLSWGCRALSEAAKGKAEMADQIF